MRESFIEELCVLAESNPNLWLVCGDLGYGVLERFAARFPNQFLNAGVAEQNMTGIAAGLAMSGKTVFTYSIANFPVIRCLEQIRNDVCYHNLDVKVVAVGGGLAYGGHGYTHHGIEDFAVTGALPNMTIVAPADPAETRAVTRLAAHTPGPAYIRLGKAGEPRLHTEEIDMQIGRALKVRSGSDLTLISTGGMLEGALKVADMLRRDSIYSTVLSMPYLLPFDDAVILEAASSTPAILTIEEHGWGGLGTRTAEILAIHRCGVHFVPMRLRPEPIKVSGSREFLRDQHGIGVSSIYEGAKRLYKVATRSQLTAKCMMNVETVREPTPTLLRRAKHWIGLDQAIGFTILGRGWSSVAGLVNIFLIARFLSPDQQGYYYTFGSLVAVQIVFELGFSFVIQQMASHERAHLEILESGEIRGDGRHHARLASILQKTVRWYFRGCHCISLWLAASRFLFLFHA